MLITDCPTIEVKGIPHRMTAHLSPDGEIVIWDGTRQYTTGAQKDGQQFRKALRHHWATVWQGLKHAD